LDGTKILRETWGDNVLIPLYDNEDSVCGIVYNDTPYYFKKNLQGDVVALYDENGVRKVEYLYDAWGNCTTIYGAGTDLAKSNPIRYRGYYFDRETGLYYLNARYYNPQWRRFISPDDSAYLDHETVNGLNLYCYCGNDPVNRCDPSGRDWDWGTFFTGLLMVGTAITAIALSVITFGAGIPLAMSIVAGVTLGAGILTGVNGIATMIEAGANGYNFMRDGLFNDVFGLSDSAYYAYAGITEGVAAVGSMVLGFYHTTGQYKAAKASQKYLGKGYSRVGENRWLSKDGLRQVRWDTTHHPYRGKPSPLHFDWYEYANPIGKGIKGKPIADVHIWLKFFSYYS
jgi:RHS repeat-associated protein